MPRERTSLQTESITEGTIRLPFKYFINFTDRIKPNQLTWLLVVKREEIVNLNKRSAKMRSAVAAQFCFIAAQGLI